MNSEHMAKLNPLIVMFVSYGTDMHLSSPSEPEGSGEWDVSTACMQHSYSYNIEKIAHKISQVSTVGVQAMS